jgi:uncharacterized protein (DUF2225 family)
MENTNEKIEESLMEKKLANLKHDKMITIILREDIMMYQNTNLNFFFLEKRASKKTVQGIMASWCTTQSVTQNVQLN